MAEAQAKEFEATFGVPIENFYHPVLGFDILSFDSHVGTPDGVSCANHVRDRFGESAVALIRRILAAD